MKCAVHQDADATGYCRNCGKPMCPVCVRPVRDVLYCEDCLATVLGHNVPPVQPAQPPYQPTGYAPPAGYTPATGGYATPVQGTAANSSGEGYIPPAQGYAPPAQGYAPPSGYSPYTAPPVRNPGGNSGLAFVLGLFPGLGAVYNGEYNKALIHIIVFAAIIVGLSSDLGAAGETLLSFLLAGFIIYMAFDSMRTAQAKNRGEASVDPLETWSKNRPVGPMLLIGLGILFLLSNFHFFDFFRIGRLWPLILIGVGFIMFRNRLGRS